MVSWLTNPIYRSFKPLLRCITSDFDERNDFITM